MIIIYKGCSSYLDTGPKASIGNEIADGKRGITDLPASGIIISLTIPTLFCKNRSDISKLFELKTNTGALLFQVKFTTCCLEIFSCYTLWPAILALPTFRDSFSISSPFNSGAKRFSPAAIIPSSIKS